MAICLMAFQYADWVFDGDDIAAVVRVGAPESRGLPVRQHDSNMMCFVRIENFRDLYWNSFHEYE